MQYRLSFSLRPARGNKAAAHCPVTATKVANAGAKIADSRYWKSSVPARRAASKYYRQAFRVRPADGQYRIWHRSFSLWCRDWNYQEGR